MRLRVFVLTGLLAAVLLGGVVSYWASSSPDGLERVAADHGFGAAETPHEAADSPLAGYGIAGVDHVLGRLVIEVPFVIFALLLPFLSSGPQVTILGVVVSQTGLWDAWNILAKATLGVTVSLVLASTTSAHELLQGVQRLRAPGGPGVTRVRGSPPASLAGPGTVRRGLVHPRLRARRTRAFCDAQPRVHRADAGRAVGADTRERLGVRADRPARGDVGRPGRLEPAVVTTPAKAPWCCTSTEFCDQGSGRCMSAGCGSARTLRRRSGDGTHDLPYALQLCPRSVLLDGGVLVADRPTADLLGDPGLMRAHRMELPFGFGPAVLPQRQPGRR